MTSAIRTPIPTRYETCQHGIVGPGSSAMECYGGTSNWPFKSAPSTVDELAAVSMCRLVLELEKSWAGLEIQGGF